MTEPAPARASATGPVDFLREYLRSAEPRFVLLVGDPGSGKSALIRRLRAELPTSSALLLYQPLSGAPGVDAHHLPPLDMLVLPPTHAPGSAGDPRPKPAAPSDPSTLPLPAPLKRTVVGLGEVDHGTLLVDSWDRESEGFVRSQAGGGPPAEEFTLPATEFGRLQTMIRRASANIVLASTPPVAEPFLSLADASLVLRQETRVGSPIHVASLSKVRGTPPAEREQIFVVTEAGLETLPPLPVGFAYPASPPDPDPEPAPTSLWPGSAEFRRAFGRLRYGSFTALALAPGTPDALIPTFALPLVLHVLRGGGRVVWLPSPTARPARLIGLLQPHVAPEWLLERFRVLSPVTEESGLGELGRLILPLRRETITSSDGRPAAPSVVRPLFPEAFRFLSQTADPGASLYVMSIEGLKAVALAAKITPNTTTLPAILATYGRLPRFHGFGYGRADDPIAAALLPGVETVLQAEMICGRPVVYGLRPQVAAHIVDWPAPDAPYVLRA